MTITPPDAAGPLLVRDFDAPRAQIFQAWTDPGLLSRWISPEGCTAPDALITIDLRVGGRFDYCLVQTSDGARFWMRNQITALEALLLLVFTSEPMPEHGRADPVTTRVRLDEHGTGTRMTFTRPYPADRRPTATAGWGLSFDHLAALLASPGRTTR
jgi:uncharacterized protein YndB with AHSA1/START domain